MTCRPIEMLEIFSPNEKKTSSFLKEINILYIMTLSFDL